MIDKMNDFLLVFMGIFILLLIFLVFLLLAYVYHTYTTYTIDVNKNLETSETTINNTSNAFNKLQDNVINELAKVNKNQETIVSTVPNNLISFSSNILSVFALSSNNIKNYDYNDMITPKLDINTVNIVKPFTSYKTFTSITDANNFLTICDTQTTADKSCIKMNVQNGNYNIYTSNATANANIKSINIYDSNNSILASFDTIRKNISLGSNIDPAISIINNVYTPGIIVGKCTYQDGSGSPPTTATLTLSYISNFKITPNNIINFPIFNNFTITTPGANGYPSFVNNILKIKPTNEITKDTLTTLAINITKAIAPLTTLTSETTTNGYITLS
jgi:hypothetical protein